jgi:hypothetical protein
MTLASNLEKLKEELRELMGSVSVEEIMLNGVLSRKFKQVSELIDEALKQLWEVGRVETY